MGSYGRTLINDLAPLMPNTELLLYAPDDGRDDLRNQIEQRENVHFCYPDHLHFRLQRDLWRMKGIVKDLQRDGVELYHGLSGELPQGLSAAGIPGSIRHCVKQHVSLPSVSVRSVIYCIMVTSQRIE